MKMIVCCDKHFGIGYKNKLLFHIKEDMERFKKLIEGKVVVCGRNTFDSMEKMEAIPLKNQIHFFPFFESIGNSFFLPQIKHWEVISSSEVEYGNYVRVLFLDIVNRL